jgi:hypothetical protein
LRQGGSDLRTANKLRLTTATATISLAQQWRQTFAYDGFGNMYKLNGTGEALSTSYNYTVDSAKNQIPSGGFRANGTPASTSFDVAARMTISVPYQLGYAPDNKRVVRTSETQKRIYYYSGIALLGIYNIVENSGAFHHLDTVKQMRYVRAG